MLVFFKRLLNNLIKYIFSNKTFFFVIALFIFAGIVLGLENVLSLKDDLDLTDITDTCFTKASSGKWEAHTFYFNRILILILPIIIAVFAFNIYIAILSCFAAFANAYFYAFNFTILLYNLHSVGALYVFIVCLPCYLIYNLCLLCLYLVAFNRSCIRKKYNNYYCFSMVLRELKVPIMAIFILFSLAVFYEMIFLYFVYNKYLFAMC